MSLPAEPTPRASEAQLRTLTDRVFILPDDPLASFTGWRRRVAGFVWRFLGPSLQRQQEFNGAVAECITQRIGGDLASFIINRDREVQQTLSDALSSVADDVAKRWESMVTREQRYEARVAAQAKELAEMQTRLASVLQLSQALKREMERLQQAGAAVSLPSGAARDGAEAAARTPVARATAVASDSLAAYKYVGFEDHFRGSIEQVRANLSDYLPDFEGASDVLDVGCGRGEFLQLLADRGVVARGVDVNHEMVEACRARGLDVVEGDAVEYLRAQPEGSLGGLFAAQVVEHLDPDRLLRLLDLAFSRLRPGAPIVLETINPACWAAFFDSYIRDLTHVRPVHPDTIKFLLQATGFQGVDIRYRAPYAKQERLQTVSAARPTPDAPAVDWLLYDLGDAVNANVEKLNSRLFTFQDYAAVARRP